MREKRTVSIPAIALAAVGALLLVCFRAFAVEAAYPVERAHQVFVTKLWTRITGLFRGSAAEAECARLRREVATLSVVKSDLARLELENARLKRALGYVSSKSGVWVASGILSRGGGAAGVNHIVRVNKGTLAGVKKGAVAVVPEGLFGLVTGVTPHTAEVTLITDPSLKVSCEIRSATAKVATGVLTGGGEDRLVLRYLRNAECLAPHLKVLTSGRGGVFPPGLEVGTLLAVRKDPKGLAREGEVLPPVDYLTVEDVFIRCER